MSQPMSHNDRPVEPRSAFRRRRTVIAISGVAAVAAGVGSCLAIAAGGPSTSLSLDAVAFHQASNPSSAPPTALTIPADYSQPIGRNPFKPLVVAPPAAAPSGGASAVAPATSAPVIPQITLLPPAPAATVTVTATPTTKPSPTPTPSPTSLPTAGQPITLDLVSVDTAAGTATVTVTIGGTTTTYANQKPGQVFGVYFKLVSIFANPTVTPPAVGAGFQYGDLFVSLEQGTSAQLA